MAGGKRPALTKWSLNSRSSNFQPGRPRLKRIADCLRVENLFLQSDR